eukprot:3664160-Rhodomonas_salina.1
MEPPDASPRKVPSSSRTRACCHRDTRTSSAPRHGFPDAEAALKAQSFEHSPWGRRSPCRYSLPQQ